MKVLMINVVCGIRSTGRICTDLATVLEEQGHEVKIAYGRERVPKQFQKYAVRIGNDFDVMVHALRARLFDECGFGSKAITERFIKWIKNYDPDVIHLHNLHGYYINLEVLFNYLRICGKRIIWTLHDCWAFTGHTAYCDAYECEKWKSGCEKCPGMREYPVSYIDRSMRNWNKKRRILIDIPMLTIVTPSKWMASMVKNSFLNHYNTKVIPNGIDIDRFHMVNSDFKEKNGLKGKHIILGVATAWDEMKGLSDYYKLADALGDNYKVVLVGLNKSQILDLPHNILGIEKTNSIEELVGIYSISTALVVLSKVENYPTVIIEALCCELPVISYDVGGAKEIIRNNGVVVQKGDIQEVAQAISGLNIFVRFPREEATVKCMCNKYIELMK